MLSSVPARAARVRQAVQGRLLVLALTIGAILLIWFAGRLSIAWQVFLWGLLLLGVALQLRRVWHHLFGPVLVYDLVRTARRGQLVAHRCLYALLIILILVVVCWFQGHDLLKLLTGLQLTIKQRAALSGAVFASFMMVQYAMVLIVTPTYTAGAIAKEKERRTLELLLATDLSNREIVLGMLTARLANLFLLVLAGLPILSLLEFLGGVEPNLVLAGFVTTGMTLLSVGGLSILVSVHAKSTIGATIYTYLWLMIFFVYLCPLFGSLASSGGAWLDPDSDRASAWVIWGATAAFTIVHGLIALLCVLAAIQQLRNAALGTEERRPPDLVPARPVLAPKPRPARPGEPMANLTRADLRKPHRQVEGQPLLTRAEAGWGPYSDGASPRAMSRRPLPPPSPWLRKLPPVGSDALLWKELNVEQSFNPSHVAVILPFAMAMGIGLLVFFSMLFYALETRESVSAASNHWVRVLGTPLACILFLLVAVGASGRVSRERERQTLEGLFLLPCSREAILFAKWLASMLSVRWLVGCLVVIWSLGLLTGGVSPASFPLLVAATLVFLAFLASLGLWLSTLMPSTMRATLFTLLVGLLFILGPGFMARAVVGGTYYGSYQALNWNILLLDYGLTPPLTMWTLAFRTEDFQQVPDVLPVARFLSAAAGLQIYLILTGILWHSAAARLRADKGPMPLREPPMAKSG
jgi:ABC-type transport system involved in multi-copper enzyme maturation permease subunit